MSAGGVDATSAAIGFCVGGLCVLDLARLMPSLGELINAAAKVPGALREGLDTLSDKSSPIPQQGSPTGDIGAAGPDGRNETDDGDAPAVEDIDHIEDAIAPVGDHTDPTGVLDDTDSEVAPEDVEQSVDDDAAEPVARADSDTESGTGQDTASDATADVTGKTDTASG